MRKQRVLSLFLALLMLMLTVMPASAATASIIRLTSSTGTVTVTNSSGRTMSKSNNMLLYNGYGVQTKSRSYAWISLDSSKLSKLDASSKASIRKSGSKLELLLKSGHLYFNVSSPLKSGESLNIRTSTMAVGIRGTCGWVKEIDRLTSELYLLEGTVQVSAADPVTGQSKTATVHAGEKVIVTVDPDGQDDDRCEITQETFTVDDIDDFVMEELVDDEELCRDIFKDSGLIINEEYITDEDRALAQYRTIVGQADTYDFGETVSRTPSYQYALVQMQTEDTVPTLLLKKSDEGELSELSYVRVFQYDPASGDMRQPTDRSILSIGIEGNWAHSLAMSGDGNGLYLISWSRATGEEYFWRVIFDGDSLVMPQIWDGTVGVNEPASKTIDWYDVTDTSALDNWTS